MMQHSMCLSLCFVAAAPAAERIPVAPVWSGHPVGFTLLTHGDRQFAAFYDAERRMTIAARRLEAREWSFVRLPQKLGWDSHNYVTMCVDREGFLHVSGNMHGVPLVYFRSSRPLDIESLERVPAMVGAREQRVTYPAFFRGPGDALIFSYRDGSSGNGDQLYNIYDVDSRTWRRLIDGPLVSGEGLMNAYIQGPTRGPDGRFHMAWVWRDTPDCATNHDLSYARSSDLVHWETSGGKPIALPILLRTAEVVDPVPAGGGLLNSNIRLAFDRQKRPVISYHKYDMGGALQIYNARLEGDDTGSTRWRIVQASAWTWRWEFSGGGSIGAQVRVSPVEVAPGGLRQRYDNDRHGAGEWLLDETTLQVKSTTRAPAIAAGKPEASSIDGGDHAHRPAATQPALILRSAGDSGRSPDPKISYRLEWRTRPPNRDRPYAGDPPSPSMLELVITR